MAFVVWVFRFWTGFKAWFGLRWLETPRLDQARLDGSPGVEQLRWNEGEQESELAAFLSSLPEDKSRFLEYGANKEGFRLSAYVDGKKREVWCDESTHREFLAAVASSKVTGWGGFWLDDFAGRKLDVKELEEIVGALVSNSNFKEVSFSCLGCSALQLAEYVSRLLLGNKAIEDLHLNFRPDEVVGKEAAELLANGLRENRVLKNLYLWSAAGFKDDEAMEVFIRPLEENDSVLQRLAVGNIKDVGLEHFGAMLRTNTSLKDLQFDNVYDPFRRDGADMRGYTSLSEADMRGYTSLSEALCVNRSLKDLKCTIYCSMVLKVLLEPLTPMNDSPQANTTLTGLDLSRSRIGWKEGVDILVDMIRTNTSLLQLELYSMTELGAGCPDAVENVVAILEALKTNNSLKTIGFGICGGVGGYKVLGTMMDMLLENRQLEEIVLGGTPLDDSGDAAYVGSELEKRKKMKVWDLIKGMANVNPRSGRVFLCGNPYAGKTTLRKFMKELSEFQGKRPSRRLLNHQGKRVYDRIWSPRVPKASKVRVANGRTRGIEVDHVECDGIDISIWDMAGQPEYHSFHDLVIPNLSGDGSCCLFLLTCNPMQGTSSQKRRISEIRSEVEYWLRFVASNTRRSWSYRPHVSVVMTHFDHWNNEMDFAARIEEVVEELKAQFDELFQFDLERSIFKVDGEDVSCARRVFDFTKAHLKGLLRRLPKTIKAVSEVQGLVAEWNAEVSKARSRLPMLKWEEFCDGICGRVEELQNLDEELARRKMEFVAMSLNDGGHLMYHEEGGFVVTNPHWFCHDIMGEFLHRCASRECELEMVSVHGMVSIKHVKRMLSGVVGDEGNERVLDEILSMMRKLHICYEQDANNIMIPSALQDRCGRLSWPVVKRSSGLTYVGRRLSCKDTMRTMLSLGFFPRLQVSFFKKFQSNDVGNSYQLFEDVIKFICDGIEVIIEFDHVDIDILLRSEQRQEKMLEFLENGVVRHIQDLVSNPTLGCPGVILVEHILRPECVERLVECTDRKDQFVSTKELELKVMTSGFDAFHNWKRCGRLGIGLDKVRDLLGDKAWEKLLQRRCENLQGYLRLIVHASAHEDSLACQSKMSLSWTSLIWQSLRRLSGVARDGRDAPWKEVNVKLDSMDKKLERMDNKLDVVIRKVDDISQMQERITTLQLDLWHEVSSRMDDLMEFSVKMQQSQAPKLAYLSEIGKKKLLTRFVPGLVEFQVHLMCESRDGVHEVTDQEGCKVKFGTRETRIFVTMLVWGLKMATILTKIGAHVAGGMGAMVPDFGEGLQLAGLVLDTPGLVDQGSAVCLESLPEDVKRRPKITSDDRAKAQEWLMDFLEAKCKERSTFYGMFKLKKVVYKPASGEQSVGWVCDNCVKNANGSEVLWST